MIKFDTKVQYLKHKVLSEVARQAWEGNVIQGILNIPKKIISGRDATMRCCVYKERAIVSERIKLAIGGDAENPNVIEVIEIACDECPVGGYEITPACRGCIAHRCEHACRLDAISFDSQQKAHIDKSKCVECGQCAKVCPYSAITNNERPCAKACKIKAISMSESKAACINNDKCISCGACVYQCPFGAIMDKSFIVDIVNIIKNSMDNREYKVYAVVAPSIASQFTYAKLGQVICGIKKLGFHTIVEAALGADIVAYLEAEECAEKGFLTSSCCPAFVDYIKKQFPDLTNYISTNLSPMATIAKYIKEKEPESKVIFIGPCTAKKMEFQQDDVRTYVDSVMTFEELQALFEGKDLDITVLEEDELNDASCFGRIFARSGGLAEAVKQSLIEQQHSEFDCKPVVCDGIEECRTALLKTSKNVLNGNFIEGMACKNGCIGGAGCLTHIEKNKTVIDEYSFEANEKTISGALELLNNNVSSVAKK